MTVEELQNFTDDITHNFTKTNEQIVSYLLLYYYQTTPYIPIL